MIITKLYTSPGLGKYLESLSIRQFCILEDMKNNISQIEYDAIRYGKRLKWDGYLDKKPTKEIFVNDIEKPFDDDEKYMTIWQPRIGEYDFDEIRYNKDLDEWQESEKRVIFEGDKIIHSKETTEYKQNKLSYYYYPNDKSILIEAGNTNNVWISELESLHDLAEITNGELVTKNIEI